MGSAGARILGVSTADYLEHYLEQIADCIVIPDETVTRWADGKLVLDKGEIILRREIHID